MPSSEFFTFNALLFIQRTEIGLLDTAYVIYTI